MARSGGFGGSVNPFGSGSLGSFGQYDIGKAEDEAKKAATDKQDNAAALEQYRTAVDWANGDASDAEYLASLRAQLESTTDEMARLSILNKIHDAEYSIGYAQAQSRGLDALIAFEQRTLAGMNPGNYRALGLRASIASHLADRRSRDYSRVVSAYNDGHLSTEQLVAYAARMVRTIPPDAPDADNWRSTLADLTDRLASEKDAEKRQDVQRGRITDEQYLAYITSRRDSYSTVSPKWDDWNRQVEDVTAQIAANHMAAADAAFFREYELGHKSDASYLLYLKRRLDGMTATDPDRARFEKAYQDGMFSLAEDKLRYDVEHGRRPASDMVAFLRTYQATLNPGSKLWRDTQNAIESWRKAGGSSSGGGGAASSKGIGAGGTGTAPVTGVPGVPVPKMHGKVVPAPRQSLTVALTDLGQTMAALGAPGVKSRITNNAGKALTMNIDSLTGALERGQAWWLYSDPRDPNTRTKELDPYTGEWTGGWVLGTRYYKVDDASLAELWRIKSTFLMQQSENARLTGKSTAYLSKRQEAREAAARAISIDVTVGLRAVTEDAKANRAAIDVAIAGNDLPNALAEALRIDALTDYALNDLYSPYASEEARSGLEAQRDDLLEFAPLTAYNPASTTIEWTDANGQRHTGTITSVDGDPSFAEAARAGRFAVTNAVLLPGWFHTVNAGGDGKDGLPGWGLIHDDDVEDLGLPPDQVPFLAGQGWLAISTTFGDQVVHSYAKITTPRVATPGSHDPKDVDSPAPLLRIDTTDDTGRFSAGSFTLPTSAVARTGSVTMIRFRGADGTPVRAFTLDGKTWIRPEAGDLPMLGWNIPLRVKRNADGSALLVDPAGTAIFAADAAGNVTPTEAYNQSAAGALAWRGQNTQTPIRVWSAPLGRYVSVWNTGGYNTGGEAMGQFVTPDGQVVAGSGGVYGGVWHTVTTITADPTTGEVNMTPTAEQWYRQNSLPAHLDDWMESTYARKLTRPQGPAQAAAWDNSDAAGSAARLVAEGDVQRAQAAQAAARERLRTARFAEEPVTKRAFDTRAELGAARREPPVVAPRPTAGDLMQRNAVLAAELRDSTGNAGVRQEAPVALPKIYRAPAAIRPFALPSPALYPSPIPAAPAAKPPQLATVRNASGATVKKATLAKPKPVVRRGQTAGVRNNVIAS